MYQDLSLEQKSCRSHAAVAAGRCGSGKFGFTGAGKGGQRGQLP